MKKLFATAFVLAFLSIGVSSFAQDSTSSTAERMGKGVKKGANKAWTGTKKAAKKVGNKTAELATEGKAKVSDHMVDGYTAPNGRKVYQSDDKYYWINDKGGREWITKDQLKQKG